MADVFAFYDCSEGAPPGQAAMVTLWARGWANRGWNPRLITSRHARRSKFYAQHKEVAEFIPLLALHAVGGGILSPLRVMNFSLTKGTQLGPVSECPYGVVSGTRAALEKYFRKPGRRFSPTNLCRLFGGKGWETFPLVRFENPADALSCGRVL